MSEKVGLMRGLGWREGAKAPFARNSHESYEFPERDSLRIKGWLIGVPGSLKHIACQIDPIRQLLACFLA